MWIDIATLFPEMCERVVSESIIGRARKRGYIHIACHQIRDYTLNRQKQVDDYPYGGGQGMVMQAQPIYDCCMDILAKAQEAGRARPRILFMTAGGATLTEEKCRELAAQESLLLVCGHYEGVDERVIEALADEELSIGDYVLTGGELAPLVVADSVCWNTLSTAGRRSGTGGVFRKCCSPATTPTSPPGGARSPSSAPKPAARTCTNGSCGRGKGNSAETAAQKMWNATGMLKTN